MADRDPIDPTETLRQIRLTLKQMGVERPRVLVAPGTTTSNFVQHAMDLADLVESLDGWIEDGGELPEPWEEA